MTLSEISIRRPVLAWMLMAGLIVFGGVSFMRMGVSQLPDVDFPVVTISLNLDGAAPEVMETDIVDIVEDAVASVEGVRTITSTSRDSVATVTVEFDLNRNIDLALQDIQGKLSQVAKTLPREMNPAVITKTNPEDQPIMWMSLSSDKYPLKDLMTYIKDTLKDEFSTVPGVGDIFMGGYVDPNLRVWISDKDLNKYSLAVNDVINAIQTEHVEPPAGTIDSGNKEFNVRTLGEATSVDEFGNLIINSRGGLPNYAPIPLKKVAQIEEGLADIRRLSRSQGKPAVGMGIRKQRGSNAVAVAQAVKKKLAQIAPQLPPGMNMAIVFDSTKFIEQSVGELNFTLVLSALLTALVCWMFLGSWTSTVNVLMAIPTSIVGTFIVLYFAGFTLNLFTLLALSLAIGIVVDDAIMVLENIIRHREMKKNRFQAALDGSIEITFAAIAATISIIAIFLPVAFMTGVVGKFFFQFGVTMTVAVLLSLLEALTLTPMRCSLFVEAPKRTSRLGRLFENTLHMTTRLYQKTLDVALHNRWKVVGAAVAFFILSLVTAKYLNKEFAPAEDQSRFLVRMQTPVGSSLSYTDTKMKEAEKFLASRPEVDQYFLAVGGFAGGEVNTGNIFITMKEKGHRGIDPKAKHELSQQELMGVCREAFNSIPDAKATIQDLSMRGFTASRGFPVEFTIQGPSWEKLAEYSGQIMKEMEKTGLMTDIDTDFVVGSPEIHVIPDRDKAAMRGVSVSAIGETINAMIGGVLVGRYPKNGHRYDIRVKLQEDDRSRVEKIKRLFVRNNRGELILLSDVVRIEEKPTISTITRRDRERAISVFANVKGGQSQQHALEVSEAIAQKILPAGYHVVLSGSAQTFKESFASLIFALVMGLFVAYMVLGSQFNSFVDPVTVLVALPFSISGAFFALMVGRQSLNIYSMIGLILLMGIVKKNSILLVDFTNQIRSRKPRDSVKEALLEACPIRLRPILMTSMATIVGAIPPALSLGPGAESRIPMAVCVIGGVLVSTLLTLLVVPCVYSLFAGLEHREVSVAVEESVHPA